MNLKELLDKAKPKTISVLLEVHLDHKFGDPDVDCLNVQKLDDFYDDVESFGHPDIDIKSCLVFRNPVKEGNAQLLPTYGFHDKKIKWSTLKTFDIVIIKRLDGKLVPVSVPEGVDLLPYSVLD